MTRFYSLLVPSHALRWGRLTSESVAWWKDSIRYDFRSVQERIARALVPLLAEIAVIAAGIPEVLTNDNEGERNE